MTHRTLVFTSLLALAACDAGGTDRSDDASLLPDGFEFGELELDDGRVGYVIGGEGPTLVLLHGWPQSWYEWHGVMPELAADYTVVTVDLGNTESAPSAARMLHRAATGACASAMAAIATAGMSTVRSRLNRPANPAKPRMERGTARSPGILR